MSLLKFTGGIAMVILFAICCIFFLTSFILANNPGALITNDNVFLNTSVTQLQNRADELNDLGQSSKELLASAEPSPVFVFLILKAAFTIPIGFIAFLIKGLGTISTLIFASLFGTGGSPFYLVFGIVTTIFLLTVITLILREIRTGNS